VIWVAAAAPGADRPAPLTRDGMLPLRLSGVAVAEHSFVSPDRC